jgi:hypothetical protein
VRALNFAVKDGSKPVLREEGLVDEEGMAERRVGSRCAREGSMPAAMSAAWRAAYWPVGPLVGSLGVSSKGEGSVVVAVDGVVEDEAEGRRGFSQVVCCVSVL